jgi:hypothetical protein
MRHAYGTAFALVLAALVAGCTYSGSNFNPVLRKFTWLSYLGGDDIRRDCRPGGFDKYRLVYNAVWDEQVRAYDLVRSATGEGALLFTTVFAGGGLDIVQLLAPGFGPWGGTHTDRRLDERQYRDLVSALDRSGLRQPAPSGLRLYSVSTYWIAMGCVDGRFVFNAWNYPSDGFARLAFPAPLFAVDNTGVAVHPPRRLDQAERKPTQADRDVDTNFEVMVGDNGLR